MAEPINTTSKITLKTYVLLLERISEGGVNFIHELNGVDNRVARELLRSGLISDDATLNDFERRVHAGSLLAITPEGIAALGAWTEQLKSQSFLHKAGDNLLRVLWLIIGLMVASLSKLFG